MTIGVFDFFSGCGGTSKGFADAGLEPVFALDYDKAAAKTFKHNFPDTKFELTDITKFDSTELCGIVENSAITLFCGCAPCQPYTKQNTNLPENKRDPRRSLLSHFGSIVGRFLPDYVFVENVPGLQKVSGNSTLMRFRKKLLAHKYDVSMNIVESKIYGVPQRRRRLVILASKHGMIDFPTASHGPDTGKPFSTVSDWIGDLPEIDAGESHPTIANHQAANLSNLNKRRLEATPEEGSRSDWPSELKLKCHTKSGYAGHTDVYGRMRWNAPATGLTTRCISLSNGRFGHPRQNRAISVREAAALQTFPLDFEFFGTMGEQAKQIGNAVPVLLANAFGLHILSHAKQVME